ncbi:hypothetical protein C8Q76DRAFT_606683 [Earliella scabrosa]|nr:hypothetical protein C8Q76DRAFT_606683 [Earliella scabrosa]
MTPPTLWSLVFLSVFSTLVWAQGPVQTFFPASIPLANRSPYLSIWMPSTSSSGPISNSWPYFWGQASIIGWAGKIRVDGQTYAWMGNDGSANGRANVTNVQVTPTRSIYVMQAGPMNITITFLSPIEPDDWVKQSFPFAYVSIEATALDGATHDVQVYSDISAELLSGDRKSPVKWTTQSTGRSLIHSIELQNPSPNREIANQAQDGKGYYTIEDGDQVTWQIDMDGATRDQFVREGRLTNVASTAFGPVGPPFPVFAIAKSLGQIQTTASPVTWAIGYVRDPTVQYTTSSGETQNRRPFFLTQFSNVNSAIDAFLSDFSAANDRAVQLDQRIMEQAAQISPRYVDLVSLGARQTLGSLDITCLGDSNGGVDASNVKIFMKDIGSSGRVSPVERMFAAFPTYLYLNASIGGALLAPLLESQDSLVGQPYAIEDLGTTYPIASGPHGAHAQGIEQTGNMLIMLYAQARISGDGTLIAQHYNLTKRWADYLVNNALAPENQCSADGQDTANMTNLAFKGIVGVRAMAEMSRALGEEFDAQQYEGQATALMGSFQSLAQASNGQRLLGVYGDQQSWSMMYNLYADRLLGTNLVSENLLNSQTQFYSNLLTSAPPFGLPVNSDAGSLVSAAWTLLTSATVTDPGVRNTFIDRVWNKINSNQTRGAFPDQYNATDGSNIGGNAGPALGAMFSHLALTVPNQTISVPDSVQVGVTPGADDSNSSSSNSNIGPIIGGVVGGIAVIGLAIIAFFLYRRHKKRHEEEGEKIDFIEEPHRPSLQPYAYELAHANPSGASFHGQAPGSSIRGVVAGLGAAPMGAFDSSPTTQTSAAYAADAYDSPPVVVSSKARERALNTHHHYAPSTITDSSGPGSEIAPSASSRDPLSPSSGTRSAASISPTEVLGLRAEVENLRRVMQEIRAERFEPPPEYGA